MNQADASNSDSDEEASGGETEESRAEEDSSAENRRAWDLRKALAGGIFAATLFASVLYTTGELGPWEARQLFEDLLPAARFLCSAALGAGATILALLLTLLAVSTNVDSRLNASHFKRLKVLAQIVTVQLITATVVLTLAALPIGGDNASYPPELYRWLYYVMVGANAVVGGVTVTVALMLYTTFSDVVEVVGLGNHDHRLALDE